MLLLLLACGSPEPACPLWYSDLDGDGFGAGEGVASCAPLVGRSEVEGDCDDRDSSVHPGAIDPALDGLDQDCSEDELCSRARPFEGERWDCAEGPVAVVGDLINPSGDPACVCSVEGDMRLSEAQYAQGFTALQSVSGTLWISEDAAGGLDTPARFPSLTTLNRLRVDGLQADLQMPQLRSLDVGLFYDVGALNLSQLRWARSLTIRSTAQAIALPELREVSAFHAYSDQGQSQIWMPQLERSDSMKIQCASRFELIAPSQSIAELRLWSTMPSKVELPEQVEQLSLGAEISTVGGTQRVEDLLVDRYAELTAFDLEQVSELSLSAVSFEAPSLLSVGRAELTRSTLIALHLEQLDTLVAYESDLSAPRLSEVVYLKGADSPLPALEAAESVDYEGELSALREVLGSLHGTPVLPAMETLQGSASISTTPESLPALRQVNDDLTISGDAWLPALRRVDGALVLKNTSTFYAPELQSVDWITVKGSIAPALPDPLPWGLRLVDSGLSAVLEFGELQSGLTLVDTGYSAPPLEVTMVHGNVVIDAPNWTQIPVNIGSIGGDLSYCLTSMAEADLQAWLADQVVAGAVMEVCE